jgi:dolichol-phosphate mannosyltransferase
MVVCITTLNEVDSIGWLVTSIVNLGHSVIVSDGGSYDGTPTAAANAGAVVLTSNERLPISTAMIKAYRWAFSSGYKRIVQMDAGNSHDPLELSNLLSHDADVVIGSRFMTGASYYGRRWRAWLSRIAALACNLAQPGAWLSDWTSGYRVYSRRAIAVLLANKYQATMHGWQIETLARLGKADLSIVEAPITYRAGPSSFNGRVVNEALRTWLHIFSHAGEV